ncbi:MAG TPA: hypothetical protein VMW91_10885 [Desulfosporosinus sp.]|nr:hypothetical protein [Desulfosporosinus sp.]
MKSLKLLVILLVACVAFIGCEKAAEASGRRHSTTTVVEAQDNHNVGGLKLDAPNLVKIDKEGQWTLGAEGGKDLMKDVFYNDFDYIESDKGWFGYIKVTYNGCLLRCEEKTEVASVEE